MINTVSITELKQNTAGVVARVKGKQPILVLQRSKAAAVLVDPAYMEKLEKALEDAQDLKSIEDRKNEPTISYDEVASKLGLK